MRFNQLIHFVGDDTPFWTFLLFILAVLLPINRFIFAGAIIAAFLLPKGLKRMALYGSLAVVALEMIGIILYVILPF